VAHRSERPVGHALLASVPPGVCVRDCIYTTAHECDVAVKCVHKDTMHAHVCLLTSQLPADTLESSESFIVYDSSN
jgi:hypothetical protein